MMLLTSTLPLSASTSTSTSGPHYVEENGVGGSPFGGVHMTDNCINRTFGNTTEECGVEEFSTDLFSLTGVLMLSYFIHNGALSIMRNAKQETNSRDLWLAFMLVCGTYAVVAVCFYMSYVSEKSEIEQNFLSNFASTDSNYIFALIAECFLLMQVSACIRPSVRACVACAYGVCVAWTCACS